MTSFLNTNLTQKNNKLITKNNLLLKDQFKYLKTTHSYHLVDPSPWPAVAALGAFMITSGGVLYMHKFIGGWNLFITGFLLTFYVMYTWWRDVIREATFEEQHSVAVQKGLRLGMILFIVSEVMFFFAFFWAFFHSSIAPVYNIGGVWPPKAITPMNTYTIPLTNTFFLLTSGATVTWAHHALVARAKKQALLALIFTLILAILFTSLQGLEYVEASFNISDGIYGSCFYMATGFHGFHVFIGTIALFVSFVRIVFNHFTDHHHFGFESAIWYWHFVDVVWLFLFINVYWWSNSGVIDVRGGEMPSRLRAAKYGFYIFLEENFPFFLLCENIFLLVSLFFFVLLYLTTNKKEPFYQKFFSLYYSLPIINKVFLFTFSLTFSIPVRIWIKSTLPRILITFYYFIIFYLATIFPYVAVFVFFQVLLLFSSLIFTFVYLRSKIFRTVLCKSLFGGNDNFAALYFNFFWGNMNTNNARRLTETAVAAVGTYLAREARARAVEKAEEKGKERTATAIQQATEPVSAEEAYNLGRKSIQDARSEDPILNAEDTLKESAKSVSNALSDWWNGS